MRFARVIFVLVVLACVIETIRLWTISPDNMAAHFIADGSADRFTSRFEFFSGEAKAFAEVLLFSLIFQFMPLIIPLEWTNMPNKAFWLENKERRLEVKERLSSFAAALFTLVVIVFQMAFELAVAASQQTPAHFAAEKMPFFIVGLFLGAFFLIIWLGRSFRRTNEN